MGLLLISCSKSSSDEAAASTSGVYKWQFKLNGVLYKREGTLLNPVGSYNSVNNEGFLALVDNSQMISLIIHFPNVAKGTFTFNSSSSSTEGFTLIIPGGVLFDTYDTFWGGSMNVNITSLSSTTQVTNPLNPGKVIGTFSGTIKRADSQTTYSITEGVFEVLRTQ